MIGARLGQYELTASVGVGGMGEVFRARDTNLGRDVAIKVLPAALANDAERIARFKREAHVLASLNHANIAHVYGFEGTSLPDGSTVHFLAMELVAGEDLAQRLKRGPLPVDEALAIAKQIAEALEEAHEHGIVHRDLKPANVKVTPDGNVKVLDFGLAKALEGEAAAGGSSDPSNSPTLSHHATEAGIILGTAAYMSPEQARGRPVDRRADIWAFGVVLYEMLSGRRAFEGDDISITLASVLKDDVQWEALPPDLAAPMRRLLRRCLEKDPKRRLSAMADARLELDEAASGVADVVPAPATVAGPAWRRALPWSVAAAMAGLSAIGWWPRPPAASTSKKPVLRLALPFTETLLDQPFGARFVLSPDGSRLAYLAHGVDTTARLFLRSLDEDGSRPIPHTEGTMGGLAFSPDSRWIAFDSGSGAKEKILLDGGLPVSLLPVGAGGGPHVTSWQSNQSIVFANPRTKGANLGSLWRVPDTGGAAELIVDPDAAKDERAYYAPDVLPDGSILFVIERSGSSAVAVLPHGKPPARILIEGARQARYVPSEYLIFAKLTTLMAASFDLEHLVVKGTPVPVLADVRTGGYRSSAFSLSATGTLVYLSSVMQPPSQLVLALVDRTTARETDLPFKPNTYAAARFAPDGKAVVFAVHGRDGERTTSALWLGEGR